MATLARGGALAAGRLVPVAAGGRREAVRTRLLDVAVDVLADLGPTYIKVAQLLTTRVDVLPASVCRGLARIYDRLPPSPAIGAVDLPPALTARLRSRPDALPLIGAGSIACVYLAELDDGRTVAVKVRRPGVEELMAADLAIVRRCAVWLQRLPALRTVPVVPMVEQLADCLEQQLDLQLEAESLALLRTNLGASPGITVPTPWPELSSPSTLVMDYVPGLRGGGEPAEPATPASAVRALHAVYQMLFLDGFVHCDLHPGNLQTGVGDSVVLLDAGFSRRISPAARRSFAAFFYRMSRGDASVCADLVIDSAHPIGPQADAAGLHRSICRLVEENTRSAVADFDLVGFAVQLFDAQRSHGYLADPEFVIPILSLIVLEGTLRDRCPDLDFQLEALPFVLRGLLV